MAQEVLKAQEEQVQELAKEKGMTKEEFTKKAQQKPKKKPAAKKPAAKKPTAKPAAKTIVTVKDLEDQFKIPSKTIRRYLRKMDANVKPRGPEKYQWTKSDPNYKKIVKNLEDIIKRNPSLQAK